MLFHAFLPSYLCFPIVWIGASVSKQVKKSLSTPHVHVSLYFSLQKTTNEETRGGTADSFDLHARWIWCLWNRGYRGTMSSSGEFSTLSSGEATGTGDDSLPSSREATAEAAGSGAGFMPLREFLDRFSLPRVVRVEGAGGRPILLYKQQQRSLRVTATLLMHRYRHDVKVGPEIVIPEGYPGEWNLPPFCSF